MSVHRWSLLMLVLTLALITLGGVVHNTESSLACPDWPLCFGEVMPEMTGGVAIEHSHRLLATLIGMMTIGLVIAIMRRRPVDRGLRALAWWSLALVVGQGLLGGITVLLKLPTLVSTAHLATSMLFFCLLLVIAFRTRLSWMPYDGEADETPPAGLMPAGPVRTWVGLALMAVYLQMILGALVRHTGSGAAVGLGPETILLGFDLGSAQKDFWPSDGPGRLHMAHRFFALLVTGVVAAAAHKAFIFAKQRRDRVGIGFALAMLVALLAQLFLGAASIWSFLSIPIVTSHLTIGALLLTMCLALRMRLGLALVHEVEGAQHGIDEALRAPIHHEGEARGAWGQSLLDAFVLTKPRLALLVVFTTAAGMKLAPGALPFWEAVLAIALITMVVAAGTTLNMQMEIAADARMERTRDRPLPAGRLSPRVATIQGWILAAIGIPGLIIFVNFLTGFLAALSLFVYLAVYTPLKPRSVAAVYVGAIPGATPIVMGWTAVTNSLDGASFLLFALLFVWQIPHFIAISLYRRDEYRAAGFKILPLVYGERVSLWHMLGTSIGLAVATLAPGVYGLGGRLYGVVAVVMAVALLIGTARGLVRQADDAWARRFFLATLVYLPVVLGTLVFDGSW